MDNVGLCGAGQRRWVLIVILLGLAVLIFTTVAWFLVRTPRMPRSESLPQTDLNPYGANFFLDREVEDWKKAKTLEMAAGAGIGWIKQQFSWEEIESLRKGTFDWAKYDAIVNLAEEYGLQVIARLDRPPDWSRAGGSQSKTRPPDRLEDYGDFVYAFVDRYRDRVRYVQIWNEPNLTAEWGFQRVDAVAYTELLEVGYRRAKEANPDVAVLSAPLAITLEDASMRGNHNDLIFLEQMYQAGAGEYFDILSANAFGLDRPPEDPPDPGVLNFRRVELQREIMEQYGDGHKPVWINEYGWSAPPSTFPKSQLAWERVTEEEQAEYTTRGIAWARENWPWLGVINIWYFRQVGDVPPDRAAYYFAMVDPEFEAQPVYEAVRESTRELGSAGPGLHEEVSAAISESGWRLALDPNASAGAKLTSDDASGVLTFSFEGSELALVSERGPDHGDLYVEVDGSLPDGLRVDEGARGLVQLAGSRVETQTVVPLARDLGPGRHLLTLMPAGNGLVVVDALLVKAGMKTWPFYLLWGLGVLLVLGGGIWYLLCSSRRRG